MDKATWNRFTSLRRERIEAEKVRELSPRGFCEGCKSSTTERAAGGCFTLNGWGTMLYGAGERCAECRSVVKFKAITVFFVPIVVLGRYRVIWLDGRRYVSRKLGANPADVRGATPF